MYTVQEKLCRALSEKRKCPQGIRGGVKRRKTQRSHCVRNGHGFRGGGGRSVPTQPEPTQAWIGVIEQPRIAERGAGGREKKG